MSKLTAHFFKTFPILILVLCMPIFFVVSREIGKNLGFIAVPVNVVGTGSMYPSLFWDKAEAGPDDAQKAVIDEYRTTPLLYHKYPGFTIMGKTYLRSEISYGDMVAFENDKTKAILLSEKKDGQAGFIKRVIGVPGDKLELKDGYVIKNGQLLDEPYINKPRSTYGDVSLPDCQTIIIPPGSYLVMGDNRKVSKDSRGELGLIKDSDITYYLPYEKQDAYRHLWRDTSQDQSLAGTPTLDRAVFYQLLNQVRTSFKLKPLVINKTLELSSSLEGKEILKGNNQYDMKQAMKAVGYRNIVISEFSIKGRYTASELLENLLYFKSSADIVLNQEIQEIGISDVQLEANGCPAEIIVAHMGGYKPADYSKETIDSWISLRDNLKEILPSWEHAVQYDFLDQNKLSELLTIYRRRLALAEEIVATMQKQAWLTPSQEERIQADQLDAEKAQELAKALNGE